jgi:magnesium transporter
VFSGHIKKGNGAMSYYLLRETIQPCAKPDVFGNATTQFVAVLTTPEWELERESFDMGIELDLDTRYIHNTKAEVNYDSLTGSFQIPDREDLRGKEFCFAFALDEKGVVYRFWEKKSPDKTVVRFVTSWASKEETVRELVRILKEVV